MDILDRIEAGELDAEARNRIYHNSVKTVSSCWIWRPNIKNNEYARVSFYGKRISAHRLSFLAFNGPIPSGLVVMHTCDNPKCVNPAHLIVGTYGDNAKDAYDKGRKLPPLNPMPGEKHPMAKLTEVEVFEIKNMLANKVSISDLARKYGVSLTTICDIKNGRSWTCVKAEKPMLGRQYSSKYTGVCFDKKNNSWKASLAIGKKKVYQASFGTELAAAVAYDNKAREYGRKLNFLEQQEFCKLRKDANHG